MTLRFAILGAEIPYTGRELRSGWVGEHTGFSGDIAAAFFGPCHVATEDLVDLDDRRTGATIDAARMLHVLIEHPGCSMESLVLRQRIFVCILCECLAARGVVVVRDGDDVYVHGRKLTVSIAAPGPHAGLIHLGINVDPSGAPVSAVGLIELGIDERDLARELLDVYAAELVSAAHAQTKVDTVE